MRGEVKYSIKYQTSTLNTQNLEIRGDWDTKTKGNTGNCISFLYFVLKSPSGI